MEISQKLLCFLFLASFAVGIALGVLYDLLSISRMLLGLDFANKGRTIGKGPKICGSVLLFAEDLGFALLSGISLLLLLYFINDGVFRWMAPVGLGSGFFVYRATLGRLLMGISEALVSLLRQMLRRLLGILCKPLLAFIGLCHRLLLDPLRAWLRRRYLDHQVKETKRKTAVFIRMAGQSFSLDD